MADILSQEEIESLLSVCDTPEESHQQTISDLEESIIVLNNGKMTGTLICPKLELNIEDVDFIINAIQRIVSNNDINNFYIKSRNV